MSGDSENVESAEIQSLIGMNSNLTVGEQVLHIQTEDLGRKRGCIVTHVFSKSGQVIRKVRFDYSKHLGHPNLAHILPRAMQAQHLSVMQRLREEGADPSPNISQTDLPCVREEEKTPPPDAASSTPRPVRLRLQSGVWDRLVEQAKADRERERAALTPIGLSEHQPLPRVSASGETMEVDGRAARDGNLWEAAVASARREFENTPPPELVVALSKGNGTTARRAYEEGLACLQRNETERSLVLLCQAVELEPWNSTYRARLRRLLVQVGDG